jgi:antitoxin ParD1/3/4
MGKNTSVLLGDYFEDFVSKEVSSGKYSSASEVIRTALRLLESEEQKVKELRKALVVGEKSGFVKNFNRKEHLRKIHDKFL